MPLLETQNKDIDAAFSLAVHTLYKNTPDSLIKAGGEYGGEWTRDVSINSWNAAALLMPEKTAYSLWSVTTDQRSLFDWTPVLGPDNMGDSSLRLLSEERRP